MASFHYHEPFSLHLTYWYVVDNHNILLHVVPSVTIHWALRVLQFLLSVNMYLCMQYFVWDMVMKKWHYQNLGESWHGMSLSSIILRLVLMRSTFKKEQEEQRCNIWSYNVDGTQACKILGWHEVEPYQQKAIPTINIFCPLLHLQNLHLLCLQPLPLDVCLSLVWALFKDVIQRGLGGGRFTSLQFALFVIGIL